MKFKTILVAACFSAFSILSFGEIEKNLKIAFVSDVHFHDVYGDFGSDFQGLKSEKTGKYATIRTMNSQMNSTRLFNENYFAFLAALEDINKKGIKLVVLPGDFSDDGQPVHVKGFLEILDSYTKNYGMEFFLTMGNHDPTTPFTRPNGKQDYLGVNGLEQPIYSKGSNIRENLPGNPVIFSEEVKEQGYEDIMIQTKNYGFYPKESYIYWETPFSNYSTNDYSFQKSLEKSKVEDRTYLISRDGNSQKFEVIDASYLVEPSKDLWILAIDSNVYIPKATADVSKEKDGNNFDGSGNTGFNNIISHKSHLIPWIEKIVLEAERQGKTLIAFSHHPMVDFYNNATEEVIDLFGEGRFETRRVPQRDIAKTFADLGLKINFAGHMHFNDTGIIDNLVNVQIPSIAAYIPAYKLLTIEDKNNVEIDTVILRDVPRFNELFEHYEKEHNALIERGDRNIWNKNILKAKNYYEFADWHIRELVRLRFLPREFPKELADILVASNGKELLILTQMDQVLNFEKEDLSSLKKKSEWKVAEQRAESILKDYKLTLKDLEKWNGIDLATDLYRLRNADELAKEDIPKQRVENYLILSEIVSKNSLEIKNIKEENIFRKQYENIFKILEKFYNDSPSVNFKLNLETGEIIDKS